MSNEPLIIEDGIVMFCGNPLISGNLLFQPMVSNAYLLENDNNIMIFDPSCGKKIGRSVETYIRKNINGTDRNRSAYIIAGHSHFDHSGNFYLSEVFDSEKIHLYVHERGFENENVLNDPASFILKKIYECNRYYNFYLSFFFPYNFLIYPIYLLHIISPRIAARIFSIITSIPFPAPHNGLTRPDKLRDRDTKIIRVGDVELRGWEIEDKVVFPTPGHSPCSVSLLWPKKKALFISDAAWPGNPAFMDASLKECVSSIKLLMKLVESCPVEFLFSAHESLKSGKRQILEVLEFRMQLILAIRQEVISTYFSAGKDKNVHRLTKVLIKRSPLFRMLKQNSYPNFVVFPYTIVALCLKEEGILQA